MNGRRVDYTPTGWPVKHGLPVTYVNYGCRCDECRRINTQRAADGRARRSRLAKRGALPDWVEHGASAYTNWGCRCATCTAANSEKGRRRKERRRAARD